MNYMKQVAEMLGVEPYDEFKVKGFDDDKFMLTQNGMFYYDEEDKKWQESLVLYDILKGTREIVKPILDEVEKEYSLERFMKYMKPKNHMKEIAQMLGVELGEIFATETFDDIWHRFTEKELTYYDDYNEMWWECNDYIVKLINGEDRIIKLKKVNGNKYERM